MADCRVSRRHTRGERVRERARERERGSPRPYKPPHWPAKSRLIGTLTPNSNNPTLHNSPLPIVSALSRNDDGLQLGGIRYFRHKKEAEMEEATTP
jgi:hypothetical protein